MASNHPHIPFFLPRLLFSFALFSSTCPAPSTNTPVPPLQWIDLTDRLSGSGPPGLSYASIGFDHTSGILLIFGGESNNFPQQQTYLLNVSSLTWLSPNPPAPLADNKPPPRSMAISGGDFAASNRHGHVVIGGKGQNGQPLSDAWEFDYINQFWSNISISPGGPSPRYSASGGIDATAAAVSDPIVPGPNNTFYIAGGFDGQNAHTLSDVWRFEVAGVLSANNADDVVGSWTPVQFSDNLPTRVFQGGAVMPSALVVAVGGCSSDDNNDNTCAQQDSHVLNVNDTRDISPDGCPAPRVGPAIVPNYNSFSSSFAKQAFMLLGTFNDSRWDDGNGLNRGEVAILDIDTGVWTRVIPSGDPSSGTLRYPRPREGAAAFSHANALVGSNPSVGSDILVFGGKDANGNYLSELWLLRTFPAQLTETNATWSRFGNGNLGSGPDSSGTGVTVEYLTTCAQTHTVTSTSSGSTPSSTASTPGRSGGGSQAPETFPRYDTDTSHKVASSVSLALLMAAVILYRMSSPPTPMTALTGPKSVFVWAAGLTGLVSFAVGTVGIVLAFTTITSTSSNSLRKRSSSELFLKTNHGKAALAFFILLYGLVPLLFALTFLQMKEWKWPKPRKQSIVEPEQVKERERQDSSETGFTALMTPAREKVINGHRATASSLDITTQAMRQESPTRPRRRSFFGGGFLTGRHSKEQQSEESTPAQDLVNNSGPTRSFEILNRGNRTRRLSGTGGNLYVEGVQPSVPRSLSDLDWLGRRQNVAAFSELDYALTQLTRAQAATPMEEPNTSSTRPVQHPLPVLPSLTTSILHVILHAAIFGICVVTLVQAWNRAPKVAFVVFLVWTVAFYCFLILLAWRGTPRSSILSVVLCSIRYHKVPTQATNSVSDPSSRPMSRMSRSGQFTFPSSSRGPYTFHQPPIRRAMSTQEEDLLSSHGHGYPRSEDDDEDEETQQRRIEEEMARRDVSIVTVPKRKLWIANPS